MTLEPLTVPLDHVDGHERFAVVVQYTGTVLDEHDRIKVQNFHLDLHLRVVVMGRVTRDDLPSHGAFDFDQSSPERDPVRTRSQPRFRLMNRQPEIEDVIARHRAVLLDGLVLVFLAVPTKYVRERQVVEFFLEAVRAYIASVTLERQDSEDARDVRGRQKISPGLVPGRRPLLDIPARDQGFHAGVDDASDRFDIFDKIFRSFLRVHPTS